MSRRWFYLALGAALLTALLFVFVLPYLQPRCQHWYHQVGFLARQEMADQGYARRASIAPEVWNDAIQEVGARPFYCN